MWSSEVYCVLPATVLLWSIVSVQILFYIFVIFVTQVFNCKWKHLIGAASSVSSVCFDRSETVLREHRVGHARFWFLKIVIF